MASRSARVVASSVARTRPALVSAARRSEATSSMYERPAVTASTFVAIDVEADDIGAGLRERDRERQPDVAEADDADLRAGRRLRGHGERL